MPAGCMAAGKERSVDDSKMAPGLLVKQDIPMRVGEAEYSQSSLVA